MVVGPTLEVIAEKRVLNAAIEATQSEESVGTHASSSLAKAALAARRPLASDPIEIVTETGGANSWSYAASFRP